MHNSSNYDYYFIMKKLTEEIEMKFERFRENTEKYLTFSVPTKKRNKNDKKMAYKIKFINNAKFMGSSSSKLANNFSKGLHKEKYKNCKSDLAYVTVNNGSLLFRRVDCKKHYEKMFDKDLTKRYENT